MPEKKNQHYVPKFYLRYFSSNGRSLNLYNFSNGKTVFGASIKRQCSVDYFYGRDGIAENAFHNIEAISAELIQKIVSDKYIPQSKPTEHTILQLFIVTLYSRTKYKYDELNEILDKIGRTTLEMYPEVDKELLKKIRIQYDNPLQFSLGNAFSSYHLAQDLRIHLLINNTKNHLITSDHPVVYYNKWRENIKDIGTIGLASKGLLIFLPLSPEILLLLYDPTVYKIDNGRNNVSYIVKDEEIENLNLLLWLSSHDNIYFYRDSDSDKIQIESQIYSPLRHKDKMSFQERSLSEQGGKLIGIHSPKLEMILNLSFIKINKQAKLKNEEEAVQVVRDQRLLRLVEEFNTKVDERKYAITDWNSFLEDKINFAKGVV